MKTNLTAMAIIAVALAACATPETGTAMPDNARQHHSINYVEFPLSDVEATKVFYGEVFGWTFQDFGPDYLSIVGAGVDGGFNREAAPARMGHGALIVLYSNDIEATRRSVGDAGAEVSKEIYDFPGGRRFHFVDPNGSEVAVWSE